MDIQAAVIRDRSEPFQIETVQIDAPRRGEVLVKVVACGMCHTDLTVKAHDFPIPLPVVLGHEGSGIVEAVGAGVTKVRPGDPVVMSFKACGVCHSCQEGDPGYCDDFYGQNLAGMRKDGSTTLSQNGQPVHGSFFQQSSFGTYALAHEGNVVKVGMDVPLEILGPLGCGIQTGAGAVMNTFNPRAGSSIAVFGAGSVGLSAVMAAAAVGCATIIAVDVNDERLTLAKALGATHTLNPNSEEKLVKRIRKLTAGGADYSLEATAIPQVFRQAVDCLKKRGVCGLVGAPPLGTEVSLDMNTILFGRTVCGIIEGDSVADVFIPRLIDLYRQGRFPFDKLISFYDLDDINQAAADSESGSVIKPVIRMPG